MINGYSISQQNEGVDWCNPNFNAIWERHGTVVCKRHHVNIFCHLSTTHERDRPWNSIVDSNRRNHFQWCHLIIKTNNCCETGLCECIIWSLGDGNTRTQSAPGLWFHVTRHRCDTLDVCLHVRRGVKLIDVQDASTVEYVTSIQRPSEVVAVHPTRQLPDRINGSRTEQSDWQRQASKYSVYSAVSSNDI